MSSGPSKIGLIGCGDWGRHILRDLNTLGCQVFVVARSEASIQRAAEGLAARIVNHINRLPEVDGAIVAVQTSHHAEVLRSILHRGIPIYCEKPLTADTSDARALVNEAGDRIFVMDKWRYHSGVLELAKIARSGEFGAVQGLRTKRLGRGCPHPDVDPTWTLLPHELAIAQEALGHIPEPIQAIQAVDESGRTNSFISIMADSVWHLSELNCSHHKSMRSIELYCDDARIIIPDAYSKGVRIVPIAAFPEAHFQFRAVEGKMPLVAELRAFVEYLKGGPPPKSSAAEGLKHVETITNLLELAGDGAKNSSTLRESHRAA